MAKTEKATLEAKFKHGTSIGANGEILYDCPIEIKDKADLRNYGITWDDCKTLPFGGGEKMTVYFYKTESRALAEYQWSYIDTEHSRRNAEKRCMIPGKRKPFIRCPDTNSCSTCKYYDVKLPPVISLDDLLENHWEPAPTESPEGQVLSKLEYQSIRTRLDAEDPRLAFVLESMKLYGISAKTISAELGISVARVYQLRDHAQEIGRQILEDYENE